VSTPLLICANSCFPNLDGQILALPLQPNCLLEKTLLDDKAPH